ncbi:MAG: hypothetical protein ABEJ78_08390 [Haloferacaceae archaeon]
MIRLPRGERARLWATVHLALFGVGEKADAEGRDGDSPTARDGNRDGPATSREEADDGGSST